MRIKRIDSFSRLQETAAQLAHEKIVAVDLEADSLFHYQEQICLIQLGRGDTVFVIDPLAVGDLSPLGPLLADEGIEKVLHGADYDIRSLFRDYGFTIAHMFDTELACRYIGYRQTGLATVLAQHFGVQADKRFQRRDWSQRPLPQEMIEYAAADVAHLIPLAKALQRELERLERLAWVREECELLTHVRPPAPDAGPLFTKFKGAGKLDPRSLAVLEALLLWRDQVAQKKDRPPFKVAGSASLLTLTQTKPTDHEQLHASGALSRRQIQMYGNAILAAVESGLSRPADKLPVYPRPVQRRYRAAESRRLKKLKLWRERTTQQLDLEPGVLCNNALLGAIAICNPTHIDALATVEGIKNWQLHNFGTAILRHLSG